MIEISVPTSKSQTQRAMVLAALAPGRSLIVDPLRCDDSEALRGALACLGVKIEDTPEGFSLEGGGPLLAPRAPLHLDNAGTAMRFCTALSLLASGPVTLDGNGAMRRRPMPGLLDALRALGARVQERGQPACPPITVVPPSDLSRAPNSVTLDAAGSSQQLSALLLVAPRLPRGLKLELTGSFPSRPYVDLTIEAMADFGIQVDVSASSATADAAAPTGRGSARSGAASPDVFRVPPKGPEATRVVMEGDHSSASYPLAAGFLTGRRVRVTNLRPDSRQGDRIFPELLDALRRPSPRVFHLEDTPDIAPTLATCALFASGESRLTGLAHLRIKECDRLAVLSEGFRRVGADLDELPDGLVIRPRPLHGDADLDPAGDHRMAMCFALLGLRLPGLRLADSSCVTKSYPSFFEMLDLFAR